MARQNYTAPRVGEAIDNSPTAVIWNRGYGPDQGVQDAEADARSKGCKVVVHKNENHYDDADVKKIEPVSFCYTDDDHIAADYKKAEIEVIKLAPRTAEEIDAITVKAKPVSGTTISESDIQLAGELAQAKQDAAAKDAELEKLKQEMAALKDNANKAGQKEEGKTDSGNQGKGQGNKNAA